MAALPVLDGHDERRIQIAKELEALAPGQVRFGRHDQMLYATDASIYQVAPLGVVVPKDAEAMVRVVEYCGRVGVPLLPRGGGTSLPGQCTNEAVVLDHSAFCRGISGANVEGRVCYAEAGATVDEVNRELAKRGTGLFYAPDPATAAQATIGGCIGNNAAGARSLRYGRTSENVAGVEVVLTNGRRMWLEAGAGGRDEIAMDLARRVEAVVGRYAKLIRERFPKTLRRNAGYGLDLILAQMDKVVRTADLDLSGLICGSEGTLAVVLGAKLKLHPVPRSKGLAIVSFGSVEEALEAVVGILGTGPSAVELLDDVVLDAARGNAECRGYMDLMANIGGEGGIAPRAILYVEYQEMGGAEEVQGRFAALRGLLAQGTPVREHVDQTAILRAWALRKSGEPLLHGLASHRKPVTCVEDNAVPVERLVEFVGKFKKIVGKHGTRAAYYAHASVGVLHVRPMLDLHNPGDLERLRAIALEVADLAKACGGVMSGEHGDGRLRGPLLERFYGPELMRAFREIKDIFDPAGILNPGNIVSAAPLETMTEHLRVAPEGRALAWPEVETYFDYSDQEGFSGAVEMCNGAGVCRKTAGGAMCPSYRATLDERHSTRGRGNALRLAITGQSIGEGESRWNDAETLETLSLCLSCKACKTECPSNVDMSRLKAEYLAQGYKAAGKTPLQARVLGNIRTLNAIGAFMPAVANWMNSLPFVRRLLNRMLGLAPERPLPTFSDSLYRWFEDRPAPAMKDRPTVVLFGDCFTTYNESDIGRAAVGVLERLGYRVVLPRTGCCGRSMISMGLLPEAIRSADQVLRQLEPFINDDRVRAIVVCEPSCLSAMKDDWLQLKLKTPRELRQKLIGKALLIEEFVEKFWSSHPVASTLDASAATRYSNVLFHGHCHQKALWGERTSSESLRRLVGGGAKVLPSGCCGMAGGFGYDAGKYELSMKITEQSLLGHLRAAPEATIVASGTSCRHQILHALGREAIHPAQLLRDLLVAEEE